MVEADAKYFSRPILTGGEGCGVNFMSGSKLYITGPMPWPRATRMRRMGPSKPGIPGGPSFRKPRLGTLATLLMALLLAGLIGLPSVSGAYMVLEGSEHEHRGYLVSGSYDAILLKGTQEGQILSLMVEPQVAQGKFDVYLFNLDQFNGYEEGQSAPKADKAWTKVYKVLDEVGLSDDDVMLVVDNNNQTANGASSMGRLNYTLTLKISDEPFLKKNGLLIAGGLSLVVILGLVLVILVRRDKEIDMPQGTGETPSASSPRPPAPPGVAPPPPPPPPPGKGQGPVVRGGSQDETPPPPPPASWSKKRPRGSDDAPSKTSSARSAPPPPVPPPPPSSSDDRPSSLPPDGLITVKCPGCGVHIEHDPRENQITCSSCGLSGALG